MQLEGIRKDVFLDRYSLKDQKGAPMEQTPEEMWRRVARGVAQAEKKEQRNYWEEQFSYAMQDFKFVPGGRVLAGAGTGYAVTFYNCFVLPSPPDSRDGILDNLKAMIEIMARGGGVGINLSSLRPRGARVKKVNGFSSGPCNWAEMYSLATHDIIQQGGSRRGALMVMLWDWHPDIEEFITVKKDLTRINGANLSVCASDAFMEAVKGDGDWDLVFPDLDDPEYDAKWDGILDHWKKLGKKVIHYKTVKARHLWDLICEAAWRSAEPGLVFMERYNKWYNNWYWNTVNCVNPCVTGDTLVATEHGWMKAKDLTPGLKILTPKGLKPIDKVYNNGKQRIFEVIFSDGGNLNATSDHKLRVVRGKKFEWVRVSDLKKGDQVVVVDKAVVPQAKMSLPQKAIEYAQKNNLILNREYDRELGFLMGVTIGDGYFGQKGQELGYRMKLCFGKQEEKWGKVLVQALEKYGTDPRVVTIEHQVPYEDGSIGLHGSKQISLYKLANVLGLSGLVPKTGFQKEIPYGLLNLGEEFQKGLLDGLFSTDGSVSMKTHDPMLRLSSSSKSLLNQVRLLLLNFGIHSRIYKFKRRHAKYDGRDMIGTGFKYDLLVMNEGIARFYELIGLSHPEKAERLKTVVQEYYFMGGTNLARVVQVSDTKREEEVYDVHEPETLTWVTNGYVSFDCGEEGLPAWGVCNLASLNLSAFVKGYDVDTPGTMDYEMLSQHARIAVRFQDDVVDTDKYVFAEIEAMQKKGERRIGLGTMGLGDALIKMHLRYGSEESLAVVDKIYKTIRDAAYDESVNIAKEKGPFPKIDIKKHLEGYFIKKLPDEIRRKMKKYGVRNSVLLQAAPTGTTSLLSGVSSGIEPVYEFEFIRKSRLGEHKMYHSLYDAWRQAHPNESRPSYFVSANDLTPEDHVLIQAAIQKYIDASISKTVNAPNAHTVEDVKKLYTLAYEWGCKGITYMREGSRAGVLQRVSEKKEEQVAPDVPIRPFLPRPMVVEGVTYQAESPVGKTYITINHHEGKPFEVFITNGKSGSDVAAMSDALGRIISILLRLQSSVPARERMRKIVSELSGLGGARSVGFGQNRVRSLPDAVAKVIARYCGFRVNGQVEDKPVGSEEVSVLNGRAAINGQAATETAPPAQQVPDEASPIQQLSLDESQVESQASSSLTNLFDLCPECGAGSLAYEEGCQKCYSCGYSAC